MTGFMDFLWKCKRFWLVSIIPMLLLTGAPAGAGANPEGKTARINPGTPLPTRFIVKGSQMIDLAKDVPVFFRGIGYSPYLPGETPIYGEPPGNDDRYEAHLKLIREMSANYIHVFPINMPSNFFVALDKTDLVYGQDIFVWAYEEDFLTQAFLEKTLKDIKAVIDHTYKVGRPDRLVLFSVGDELQADSVVRTDTRHPEVRDFEGKHLTVHNRTPTEVAIARLIDGAMEYELTRYGRRHLYSHTSWTHIGPISDRPDLEVPKKNVLEPDIGDLICINVYTYARGVRTSPPGSVTQTAYQGYLDDLLEWTEKPIFITQVGLSTSPFEPKSWVPGFGGHRVEDVPKVFASVWKDIRTSRGNKKFCGISFFELNDEWWKSGEDPTDSTRHEREDPEEWFGLYEVGPDRGLVPKGKIPEAVKNLFINSKP
jgi:hypothetical protein